MVYCCVPHCSSGTNKKKKAETAKSEGITFHGLPLAAGKEELLKKWLKKISRDFFVPNSTHKVCSRHFLQQE